MRIALLETAPPEPDFDARFGSWARIFDALLADPALELVPYAAWRGVLPRVTDADATLVPGGLASANDDAPWIDALLAHLRAVHAAGQPLVGICFGHQVVARALGGQVTRRPPAGPDDGFVLGVRPVNWLAGPLAGRTTRVYMSHHDEVTALPPGATHLATNGHACVQAYALGRTLGIQGHPELTPDVSRHYLHKNAIGVDAETIARAERSLDDGDDHGVVARLVHDWFTDTPSPPP